MIVSIDYHALAASVFSYWKIQLATWILPQHGWRTVDDGRFAWLCDLSWTRPAIHWCALYFFCYKHNTNIDIHIHIKTQSYKHMHIHLMSMSIFKNWADLILLYARCPLPLWKGTTTIWKKLNKTFLSKKFNENIF
jgi:hypothetical protein